MSVAQQDKSAAKKMAKAIASHYPIIYVVSAEEERVEQMLRGVSSNHYGDERKIVTWTASRGFDTEQLGDDSLRDPINALNQIVAQQDDAIYLMKDLPAYFEDNHALVRVLRDFYHQMAARDSFVVMSHPVLSVPEELKKEIYLVELELPSEDEIFDYLSRLIESADLQTPVDENWISKCAQSSRGLSFNEIRHLFLRLMNEGKFELDVVLDEIFEEKSQVLLKESCLKVMPRGFDIDSIGGLQKLKEWVRARGKLLTKEAHDAGIPMPSGVLFMGVSGCGKSLAAKTIAAAWDLQLIRLDMNLILSGVYGPPEFAFDRATRVAENIAPVVLWIDEIENSFGYDDNASGSGGNVNIFTSFLTWMQEKPTNVFVAATANRINKLPAEMIRKGRFDQVFFVDLPWEEERQDIFRIHIEANGGNVEEFDMKILGMVTQGWSGAEIEQVVKAARIDAFDENRPFNERDITRNTGRVVPLSKTMNEQVNQLRGWSMERATPASTKPPTQKSV